MSPEAQVLMVLSWLVLVKFLQVALWPRLVGGLGEYAAPVAYPASVLTYGAISWYAALAGLPVQTALVPFVALAAYALYRREYTQEALRSALVWDAVFLVFFAAMLSARFVTPSISFAEKFMDHAFLASVMREPIVPPLDPWSAGGTLDVYYYLGYWIMGVLGVTAGVPSAVAYNLALPTIAGAAAVTAYATGRLLVPRLPWTPLVLFLLVNPAFIREVVIDTPVSKILWNSTRVIDGTINEYTAFSFVWGDLHPHVVGIFVQFLLVFLVAYALCRWEESGERVRWTVVGLSALALGSMPAINSWDVLLYAPLIVAVGLLIWRRHGDLRYLLAVPPLAVALYAPYYLMFHGAGVKGLEFVTAPSDPVQFLLVHGFFLAVLIALLIPEIRRRPALLLVPLPFALAGYLAAGIAALPLATILARRKLSPEAFLCAAGLVIVIVCEFVYLKDNMGETYFRMNTIFKCYSVAWILLGTGTLVAAGKRLAGVIGPERISAAQWRALGAVAAVALVIAPFAVPIGYGTGTHTLDGAAWIADEHPGDAEAIAWLRTQEGDLTLVEAVEGDYTYYSRVSSFTGIPAVLGMPFHEQMWRDDWPTIAQRKNDVQAIYEDPSQSLVLMEKYGVTHLYVGDLERSHYQISLPSEGLVPAYDAGGVTVYIRQ